MGLMGFIGRLHPRVREYLVGIVPPSIPNPRLMLWFTGFCELAGSIGLLIEVTRPWAALGFLILFISVFPANIFDARRKSQNSSDFRRRLLKRGTQQVIFLALALWVLVGPFL